MDPYFVQISLQEILISIIYIKLTKSITGVHTQSTKLTPTSIKLFFTILLQNFVSILNYSNFITSVSNLLTSVISAINLSPTFTSPTPFGVPVNTISPSSNVK